MKNSVKLILAFLIGIFVIIFILPFVCYQFIKLDTNGDGLVDKRFYTTYRYFIIDWDFDFDEKFDIRTYRKWDHEQIVKMKVLNDKFSKVKITMKNSDGSECVLTSSQNTCPAPFTGDLYIMNGDTLLYACGGKTYSEQVQPGSKTRNPL